MTDRRDYQRPPTQASKAVEDKHDRQEDRMIARAFGYPDAKQGQSISEAFGIDQSNLYVAPQAQASDQVEPIEISNDGSNGATQDSSSGETETEKDANKESKLPNGH